MFSKDLQHNVKTITVYNICDSIHLGPFIFTVQSLDTGILLQLHSEQILAALRLDGSADIL